jgi:hypothetical protein
MGFSSLLTLVILPVVAVRAANFKRVTCPDGKNTATNAACCDFFALRDDLQANLYVSLFIDFSSISEFPSCRFENQCGEETHEVLRLAFRKSRHQCEAMLAYSTWKMMPSPFLLPFRAKGNLQAGVLMDQC